MNSGSARPGGFKFFAGLAVVVGILGLLGNATFLALSLSHGGVPGKVKAIGPSTWLSMLHLLGDAGYIVGGINVKKHVAWAPWLLVICAATSLAELFYNTAISLSRGLIHFTPVTILYFLLPLLIEGSILIYFSRSSVRDFVKSRDGR